MPSPELLSQTAGDGHWFIVAEGMSYSLRKVLEVQRALSDSLLPLPISYVPHTNINIYLYMGKQTERREIFKNNTSHPHSRV